MSAHKHAVRLWGIILVLCCYAIGGIAFYFGATAAQPHLNPFSVVFLIIGCIVLAITVRIK